MTEEQLARFVAKVDFTEDCWLWTAAQINTGYGAFAPHRKVRLAHRVSYEHFVGPIPVGLTIDHLCRNPLCVNPEHLEAVTMGENVRRGDAGSNNRVKTHCPHGHRYDAANTILYKTRFGITRRECRACREARNARRRTGRPPGRPKKNLAV